MLAQASVHKCQSIIDPEQQLHTDPRYRLGQSERDMMIVLAARLRRGLATLDFGMRRERFQPRRLCLEYGSEFENDRPVYRFGFGRDHQVGTLLSLLVNLVGRQPAINGHDCTGHHARFV